jgi:hypothetical protein
MESLDALNTRNKLWGAHQGDLANPVDLLCLGCCEYDMSLRGVDCTPSSI